MLSASPSLFFSHKVDKIKFEKQMRILSQLTVTELGLPVSESSTRISKFHDSNDSEHQFYKTRIKNWLPIGFKLGTSWLRAYSHNHYTMVFLQYDGRSYSSCFMRVIVVFKFCIFLLKFSNTLPFFWKIACMPLLYRVIAHKSWMGNAPLRSRNLTKRINTMHLYRTVEWRRECITYWPFK